MKQEYFNAVINERLKSIKDILARKGKEYATEDRLHNFRRASAFMNKTLETVCWGFAMKHITSIADMVDDIEKGEMPSLDFSNEKIGDAINYLILLEAIIDEHKMCVESPRYK